MKIAPLRQVFADPVTNAKKFVKDPASFSSSMSESVKYDTLAEILQTCKATISTLEAFIRSVEAAPEPMCVLATDYQLSDMERFTTGDFF